jgi:hypothetical protein
MEQDGHDFAQLLLCDDYTRKLYTMQLEHRIQENAKEKPRVRRGIMKIVRALENRTRFAIQQKERLKYHVNLLRPPDLRSRVICEVNSDLRSVIAVITHFTEYDQDLYDMAYEAGRCMNDNLEDDNLEVSYGYPALIEDDEE